MYVHHVLKSKFQHQEIYALYVPERLTVKIENKTRAYLEIYRQRYDSFKIAYETYGGKFWKYIIYPSDEYDEWCGRASEDYEAEHREIFPDEIIIETDLKTKRQNMLFARRLCKRLVINGFSYLRWDSGNKSQHIQLFFPQLRRIYSSDKRKKIKELFIRWLCACKRHFPSCSYCDGDRKGNGIIDCPIVLKNVDMQLCGKHMIRMEHAIHPKTGKRKKLEESYTFEGGNKLPSKVIRQFKGYAKHIKITNLNKVRQSSKMMCLHYFLNKGADDCRARICFSLASNLIKNKGAQETRDILHSWNNDKLDKYLRPSQIESVINSVVRKNIPTGCAYNMQLLRELGLMNICDYCWYKRFRKST